MPRSVPSGHSKEAERSSSHPTFIDGSADCVAVVADIATLARKLADIEPYQSMSGADALRALASYLDRMASPPEPGVIVGVTVRPRRTPGGR